MRRTWPGRFAAVLHGDADASLLDSYEAERRPHALEVVHTTLLNMQSFDRSKRQAEARLPRKEFLNERGLIFGARYQSPAVVPDGSKPPEVNDPVTEYVPSAHPGCRAPHVWLENEDRRISTIDLVGTRVSGSSQPLAARSGGPRPASTACRRSTSGFWEKTSPIRREPGWLPTA